MNRRARAIAGSLLLSAWAFSAALRAQEDYPKGAEGGRRLTEQLRAAQPPDGEWKGNLKIVRPGAATVLVPVSWRKTATATNWTAIYETGSTNGVPAEKLTIIYTTNGANRYLYARAPSPGAPLGEAKELTGGEANLPLAGSDFWLSDLGFEFYHWPRQDLLKGELCKDTSCYVLISSNSQPGSGYAELKSWIAKESLAPVQAEARGADGKLLKEYEVNGVEKVNGRWEVKELEISTRKTHSRTYLQFDLESGK